MARLPSVGKKFPLAYFLCAGMLLVSIARLSRATTEPPTLVDKSEPEILNLGLPRALVPIDSTTGKAKVEELERTMRLLFEKLYCSPDCKGNRPLQINIALANDYQILDWLGKGLIDGAAIPALSLYLIRRDDVDLVEIDHANWKAPVLKLPDDGYVPPRELGKFWQEIWERAKLRAREKDKASASASEKEMCPLLAPSHLSTSGFLAPVAATSQWLDKQIASEVSTTNDLKARNGLANEFWREFFDHIRFTFDLDSIAPGNSGLTCAPIIFGGKQPGPGDYHLVISTRRATTIFPKAEGNNLAGSPSARSSKIPLNMKHAVAPALDNLRKIFPKLPKPESKDQEDKEKDSIPGSFQSMVFPEPYFGVRTFAFTIDESIDLLRQQQETREDLLALVLPGGGVKAGFQSRLIEYLYENNKLRNYQSTPEGSELPLGSKALDVSYLIGTSGGALLGFFVAQIGDHAPSELSKLLWEIDGHPLRSTDVFGFFDLPRYFSFLAILTVLCLVLWSPVPRWIQGGTIAASQQATPDRRWRLRPLLTIGPILVLTPIIIRYINGAESQEHVPEVEGFYYALFALIAMFADQCLLIDKDRETPGPRWMTGPFLASGATLLLGALMLRWWSPENSWLKMPLSVPSDMLQLRSGSLIAIIGTVFVGVAFGAIFVDRYRFADEANRIRWQKWRRIGTVLFSCLWTVLLLGWLLLKWQSPDNSWLKWQPLSFLEIFEIQLGALLVCIGILAILIASLLWTGCSSRYRIKNTRAFFSGVAGVGLAHIGLVYLTLWVLIQAFPDAFSFLELIATFWYWLLGTALVMAIVLVWISYCDFMPRLFRNGVDYLSANHPNGNVVSRRFLRLLLLAVFAVGWWNFIVAPGLYGNKHAARSITEIIRGFELALDQANQPTDQTSYLTSRLIIPANVLERDGTRYFLFAPTEKDCPDLVRRPGDGATWRLFHVDGSRKEPDKISVKRCGAKDQPYDLEYLKKVVFASGSPFPVFPAHRVDKESLVDGGYSNNVPLDAAQTVSADLVLIVESSNPLGHKSFSSWWRYLAIQGELIGSLPRLLSFLYERSQQIDRLSRSGLFVVSLAPPREEADWPFLVDFRPKTVKRMQDVAEKNLSKRIGMVQSWGRPRFQLTLRFGRLPQ